MTHPSHSDLSSLAHTAPELGADEDDADPRPLIVGVVVDGAGWSEFGDVETLVAAAADAVGARAHATLDRAEATIALSCDAEVSALNGTYRGKPKPTNVLSFPAGPSPQGVPEPGRRFLGDIIIARETVLAEAADQKIPQADHLQHLVVHGLLHLLGYDHENDDEALVMEALETSILAGLGIRDPYALA